MANYAYTKSLPEVVNGQTFTDDNFTQLEPNTPIFAGVSGLTFLGCNLVNCLVPTDAEVRGCNVLQISRCTNIEPSYVDYGLAQCVENCQHVTGTDEIELDGVVVSTIYHYEDKVV